MASWFGRLTVLTTVSALVSAALIGSAPAAERPARGWFTAWAQSQQGLAAVTLDNQSMRMITHVSQGGDAVRIRVQNTFGKTPLTIDRTTVGVSTGGASVLAPRAVTFSGRAAVTVPAGGEIWSDETNLLTRPDQDVAVSMYVAGTVVPGQHNSAFRDNYLTPPGSGEHTSDSSGSAYTRTVTSTYLVSAVDVHNRALKGTVVPFGSSVVDGTGSTNCGPGCTETGTNRRWTDDLARRIVAELPRSAQLAVANAGIGGTTSAAACPGMPPQVAGLDAMSRLERDVLALHGVTAVIYYYGTNDLAYGCTAEPIVTSYRQVFERLRDKGIAVYVTPITPRPGYSDQNNLDRHAVGTFVKKWNNCAGTCTGVTDFDQVLKDPLKPNSIYPAYDTGDGVHANIAGQQAIADYISLPMLVG
ncbi:GDSL-type esterase/lipase family protein [Kibdelosporangium persicum]|uniref:SGNH hydrolase n=1 Tax=Kibdelosporangium persicum TaxID=2698649 RepID=A0ABX2FCE6_9PSEU|nr:GDSL-type esterase/lipase family protein [Kibdelosporangium persicum]NRN68552.1 SGNH hydrolase [Kibdelosporangium persicum]